MSRSIYSVKKTFLICLLGNGRGSAGGQCSEGIQSLMRCTLLKKIRATKKLALFMTTFSNVGSGIILETLSITEDRFTNQHPTFGCRPLLLGWRPLLLGWRPLLLGWRLSLLGGRPLLLDWRPSLLGWRPLLLIRLEAIARIRLEAIVLN